MQHLLHFFVTLPIIGLLAALFIPRKKEPQLSGIALATSGAHLAGILFFTIKWMLEGRKNLDIKQLTVYQTDGFEFFIGFFFDEITAVFAVVGSILTLLVGFFSKFYMHREDGFKRFYCTLLLFFTGYNFIVFSGNLETLFVGWEILGITSFILIGFYRDRYLPVKNAFKVLSFYRLGDICLILGMWAAHHLFHKNTAFSEWLAPDFIQNTVGEHGGLALFTASMIALAAVIKSAQFPFSTWLPRAMEGPTTSSAIFYGSLSVHIGAFLLLRTSPFWENMGIIQIGLIAVGLVTALVSTAIARVQSSVKTQIAYSSSAQIGLIFIEIAVGWHGLALLHFAGNAFLRTYQLLVSPSVLSYRIHDMFFSFRPREKKAASLFGQRLDQAVYLLAIKEFNLDFWLHRIFWQPFKWVGNLLNSFGHRPKLAVQIGVLMAALASFSFKNMNVEATGNWPQILMALASLLLVLKTFSSRGDARWAWLTIVASQFLMVAAMSFFDPINWLEVGIFGSGTIAAAIAGMAILQKIHRLEGPNLLDQFHGHSYEHRGLALAFLVCCLAFAGFPITPTFLGVDLIFTKVHKNEWLFATVLALNFLFLELAVIRIFARVFIGQHRKMYHPVAFRSS